MVVTGCQENKSCSKVLNFLERLDDRITTHEETAAIVKPSNTFELLMSYKMYSIFYINDEPDGTFLYTETIQLHCIVSFCTPLGVLPWTQPTEGE